MAIIETLERSSAASRGARPPPAAPSRTSRKELFDAMQFGFLFDPMRKIFSIGYRVTDGSLDPGEYDLLASEARLASFIAIAKGEVPASHWFRLGRPMTPVGLGSALVSWSGSMFEYLMPALVMHSPPGSLLDQTYHLVVRRQMSYGAERGVPWGISESAYNVRDLDLTYQYSNFGVPGPGSRAGPRRGSRRGALRQRAGRDGRPGGRRAQPVPPRRGGRAGARMDSTRRSTTRDRDFPRAARWPSCGPTWRTTRG